MASLKESQSANDTSRIQWIQLALYALAGALLLFGLGWLLPNRYRATARMTLDHNVSEALETTEDHAVAAYLNRETVRLETLSYSDEVWDRVERQLRLEGWEVSSLDRDRLLALVSLPHPMDGEWRFVSEMSDPNRAATLANTWAESFLGSVQDYVSEAVSLQVEREQLAELARLTEELAVACNSLETISDQVKDLGRAVESADPQGELAFNFRSRLEILLQSVPRLPLGYERPPPELPESQDLTGALSQAAAQVGQLLALCKEQLAQQEEVLAEGGERFERMSEASLGISPYLEVELLTRAKPPYRPINSPAWLLLAGAGAGGLVWLLLRVSPLRRDESQHG